jgi:hypothetical protein
MVGQDWHDLAWQQGGVLGLFAGEQDTLAFRLAQAVGHLAATAFAAIHAFPITGELPPTFNGAGTSRNPFLKDLKGLLAIVRGRQSSPSSPQKAWIFFRQSTVLPPLPGIFPYGADPVLAA